MQINFTRINLLVDYQIMAERNMLLKVIDEIMKSNDAREACVMYSHEYAPNDFIAQRDIQPSPHEKTLLITLSSSDDYEDDEARICHYIKSNISKNTDVVNNYIGVASDHGLKIMQTITEAIGHEVKIGIIKKDSFYGRFTIYHTTPGMSLEKIT